MDDRELGYLLMEPSVMRHLREMEYFFFIMDGIY